MFRGRAQRIHFVGIGGIGMSGIAEVLNNLGYDVRGSDLKASSVTKRLASLGIQIFSGHAAGHVEGADVVVVSSAVRATNEEVVAAKASGIPVIRRAEMLAELMRLKYGVAVAGAHGKTTTTSLVATALARGKLDPTVVIGGRLRSINTNAHLGEGEYMVAEADESDGTFLQLMPTIAVITNIDAEHLDHWTGGLEQIIDAFVGFANKVPFYGAAIVCLDNPTVQAALPRITKRVLTYGFSPQADYCGRGLKISEGRMGFEVYRREEHLGAVKIQMVGRHNAQNVLAAVAVADEVGVPFTAIQNAMATFKGIARRFDVLGEHDGILVVDDYGHHPEEIRATLRAAQEAYARRIVVAFQPHRYTRTRDLLADFATCFNHSSVLFIADIYAASEDPIEGIDSQALAKAVQDHGHHQVQAVGHLDAMLAALQDEVRAGDLVLTLGAGDIDSVGPRLLWALGAPSTEADDA